MEKYESIGIVGEGSYGLVMKCRHRETGQLVAIKKFIETEDDLTVRKMALREIRMLKKLRHENLVNMIEVFRRKRRFYLVFEYLDHTLLDELEAVEGGLGEEKCREHIFQIIRGTEFCHKNNIIHRDIKPENILVSSLGVIKLCDFGFARLLSANGEIYTDYVATRWYRAPELLVRDAKYGREVDIWAIGCLFAEIMTGNPLFPGDSDIDQLFKIVKVMGKLTPKHQQLVARNPAFKGLKRTSDEPGKPLHKLFPTWSTITQDFVACCLRMDPNLRPTASELLRHPFIMKDNFAEEFIPDLRQRIVQEFQCNPLLRKYQSAVLTESGRRGRDETEVVRRPTFAEPPRWKLSFLTEDGDSRRASVDLNNTPSRRRLGEAMEMAGEESENRPYPSSFSGSNETAAVDNSTDIQASPAPFQSLQSYPQSSQTPCKIVNDLYSSTPVQSNPQVLHPSINTISFGSGRTKKSPFNPATRRDSSYISKSLQVNPHMLPFPPRTQLIRRLDRPPGGIHLDQTVFESLGEPNTPQSWISRRGPSREQPQWRNSKNDFSLPNVPGATGSPMKGCKKKLNGVCLNQNELFTSPRDDPTCPYLTRHGEGKKMKRF
ncbi:UNVERIFIED_CONTAM: hypothetical protein PYX00_002857 [Menopon gallinae]|uniref:cyclin-dependent kinase n=1 Tax=Menopon gallinae TaxID=328185 RepID=A0AAW2HZX4_9NEOP